MFPNQRAKNFFVYLPPQNAQSSTSNSKASNSANNKGRFVHHPYGEVPSNPVPCAFAQSTSTSNNAIQQQGQGPYHPALSSALGQSHVSPPVRYMSPTTGTSKSSSYGSTLMNGTIVPQPSTSNAPMQHYVIQQQQQQYTRQQHQQLGQPIQQQTVVIPAGQQAIVVNGTTVYIPANAHTIILPPGYTGPQQQHQIVVHTQPQVAPHSTMNGPTSAIPNSTQQSHFISASASQQQSQQHQVVIQQNAATSYHSQPPHLVNGMSTPNLHGPASQIIATSNATAQHNTPSIPGSRHQQMLNQQQLLTTTQSIQQQPFVSGTAAFNQGAPSTQSQPQHQSTANAVPQVPNYIDPGRTVVTVSKPPEPVFVAPSSSVHVKRVVHSEAYVRYIESMYNSPGRQQMVKKWDKALQASHKNTLVPNHRRLPYEWVTKVADGSKPKEEEIVRALWQLRNQLVEDTTGINMSDSRSNVEAIPPQPPGFEVDGKSNGNGGDKKKGGC